MHYIIENGVLLHYQGSEKLVCIPEEVRIIGDSAFAENDDIETIILHDRVEEIFDNAFRSCHNLKRVDLKYVKYIGNFAFWGCSKLEQIVIPGRVTELGARTFEWCVGLKRISLPPCLEYIGPAVFSNCQSLASIHIPHSVKRIEERAFAECRAALIFD